METIIRHLRISRPWHDGNRNSWRFCWTRGKAEIPAFRGRDIKKRNK